MDTADILISALFGGVFILVAAYFFPPVAGTIVVLLAIFWFLRSEGITGNYAAVTATIFVFIWVGASVVDSIGAQFYEWEHDGYLLIGGAGLGYLLIQQGLVQIGKRIRNSDTSSGVIFSKLIGAILFIWYGLRFKRAVSIRSIASIGIIPGVVLNIAFRQTNLGVITEFVVGVSAIGTLALVFAGSLTIDSINEAYIMSQSWIGADTPPEPDNKSSAGRSRSHKIRESSSNTSTDDSNTKRRSNKSQTQNNSESIPVSFDNLTSKEFYKMIERMAADYQYQIRWVVKTTHIAWAYAKHSSSPEVFIIVREGMLPSDAAGRMEVVAEEIQRLDSTYDLEIDRYVFMTDAETDYRFQEKLYGRGIGVVDAVDIYNHFHD